MTDPIVDQRQRLDKWLWFARVVKTRSLASALVSEGHVRLNKVKVDKPSATVKPGDVLTIGLRSYVRILEVRAPGTKRGSAVEAAALFHDITPPPPPKEPGHDLPNDGARDPGAGRPTKRDRRLLDRLRGDDD